MKLRGRRVLVVGLGISGEAAARVLSELGAAVVITDVANDEHVRRRMAALGDADVRTSDDGSSVAGEVDLVVVSPGVRPEAPALAVAGRAGIPVITEVELAYQLHPDHDKFIAVTGTNGKTTTTQMTGAALTRSGLHTTTAGNIGVPLIDAVRGSFDAIVVELSSFQLHYADGFRPRVGVLLNIAEDHIDWHGSFEAYAADKARLFAHQEPDDVAVYLDDEACARAVRSGAARAVPFSGDLLPPDGAGVDSGWIVVPQGRVVETSRLRVRGRHMLANAVAAAAAACAFGARPEPVGEALATFEAQPHRLELVATVDGVEYVNDSKATNPHATMAALRDAHDVVLIAGGRNKGLDLTALVAATPSLRAVVAIGEAASDVIAAFAAVPTERAATMEEAVERAASLAHAGDTVLLSPACSSFDMFADYKARGEAFRAAVKRLTGRGGDDA